MDDVGSRCLAKNKRTLAAEASEARNGPQCPRAFHDPGGNKLRRKPGSLSGGRSFPLSTLIPRIMTTLGQPLQRSEKEKVYRFCVGVDAGVLEETVSIF